jgi:hypothetical protein
VNDTDIVIMGSREVRVIPKGWQHPRDARGRHVPLLPADYVFDDEQDAAYPTMPSVHALRDDATEIMAYETVSEGTPVSPAFPTSAAGRMALVTWCAEHATTFGDHRADGEAWAALLFGDAGVALDGTVRN